MCRQKQEHQRPLTGTPPCERQEDPSQTMGERLSCFGESSEIQNKVHPPLPKPIRGSPVSLPGCHRVLKAAGELCLDRSVSRKEIGCDYDRLVVALQELAEEVSGLPILRSYWYDGGRDGQPDLAQILIGELPSVKLRLGRLTKYGQKGVDSLLVVDLMTLARERAIASAVLVAGDEDIREGVAVAQELGVRFHLIGVSTTNPYMFNQSPPLVSEVDANIVKDKAFWQPFFSARPRAGSTFNHRFFARFGEIPEERLTDQDEIASLAASAGKGFAQTWAEEATECEVRLLLERRFRIPAPLDQFLNNRTSKVMLRRVEGKWPRDRIRKGFWAGLEASFPEVAATTLPPAVIAREAIAEEK